MINLMILQKMYKVNNFPIQYKRTGVCKVTMDFYINFHTKQGVIITG